MDGEGRNLASQFRDVDVHVLIVHVRIPVHVAVIRMIIKY
jgi:hypothetical protein